MMERKEPAFSIVCAISKARRRFKHREDERGYLACQLEGDGQDNSVNCAS